MSLPPLKPRFAIRLAALGMAALGWQGCGGGDIAVPPDPGVVGVTVTTTGDQPDPDGYVVRLDSLEMAVGPNGNARFTVGEGTHVVALDGLAANCAVQGAEGPSRQVTVAGGDSIAVGFAVQCDPTAGAIAVTTTTSGRAQDADGYTLTVDGGAPMPIPAEGTVTVGGVAPGDHTVLLSALADNCRVRGSNPLTVSVVSGTTAEAPFQVVCLGFVRQWTPVAIGTTADLTDVWSSAPSDVFIVGEATTSRGSRVASVIRHFDGTRWVEQYREADLRLRGLWGSSPSNVYAVGFDFFDPIGRMLRYDGTSWSEVPGFVSETEQLSLESIWGTSADDIFAVGGAFDGAFEGALIYHFDGSFWQRMLPTGQVNPSLVDVWGASPTDVYAVGRDTKFDPGIGAVLHYDGSTWTPVLLQEGLVPDGVWGSSASDVFVVGFQADEDQNGNFVVTSAVWHYDGVSWSRMEVPTGSAVLDDVWGSSASDVYAVGDDGLVLHYDGTRWTAAPQTDTNLLAIHGNSSADVYAVGLEGRVIHGTP